ncbi:hypothetical protein SAMN02745121_00426 [Nannocystis exedens]|uniref:Uncharacterized protein n=1 Tax=Nannocystis exedens TaxID=54 RepID=A0A1I1T196_9BACT|nr:hypothetical protein [Nannocystis exedens]SFD52455.1 hypothetical protein SAMN02745121_00426 [Nannocystis exedens]
MSHRTWTFGPVLIALSFAPGCAQREMRAQAAVLAEAGGRLERETAEFAAARAAVAQLRQRNLVERQQQIAEQGQFNARTIHFWKVASDPERTKQLALYDALVAATTAAGAVQDRSVEWEESVLARTHALTIDRAALHRFVQQLLILASPPRFLDGARFYVEYGAIVGQQVDAGLKEVRATVGAATASGGSSGGGSSGGSGNGVTGPGTIATPDDEEPERPDPPTRGPDERLPPDSHRDPTNPPSPTPP